MTTNQLMTYGAVGFAAFAIYYITRTPGKTLATQTGQQQRDAMLTRFNDLLSGQATLFTGNVGGYTWTWTPDFKAAGTFGS